MQPVGYSQIKDLVCSINQSRILLNSQNENIFMLFFYFRIFRREEDW